MRGEGLARRNDSGGAGRCGEVGEAGDGADPLVPRQDDLLDLAEQRVDTEVDRDWWGFAAAGDAGELDAIAGAVLRAGTAAGLPCPAIEELSQRVAKRLA